MKKLFLLSIVFTLLSCSSGDDDNTSNSTNPDLVGTWFTTITDDGTTAEQTLTLQSDGTGSVSNIWSDGDTFDSELVWSATATELTINTLTDDETDIVDYELSNNNKTLVITNDENETYTYTRDNNTSNSTNPDLVGTWFTTITDDGATAEQTLTLQSDGTGSVSNIWSDGDTFDSELVWSATATELTINTLTDDETDIVDYELSNNNKTLVITNDENETYTYTRDNNNSNSTNPDLVGTWFTTITDDGATAEQTLTLQSDGTGSVSNIWSDGDTFDSELVWSATATELTINTLTDDETDIVDYELSNNNKTLVITNDENETYTYTRDNNNSNSTNQYLVGTWFTTITDDGTTAEQTLTLQSDGTGSVSNIWSDGDTFDSELVWSATATELTINTLTDDETVILDYELSNNNNNLVITNDENETYTYTRT